MRGDSTTRALMLTAAGVLAVVALVLHYDAPALANALAAVGGVGLAAMVAVNFVPMVLCSVAWRGLLAGNVGLAAFLWFRYTRDAATLTR